ncbi:serine hydrolase domain-containing protein [Sporobolomyces koalae]|uniref:serine hydrolase domain-containing protein n=1 Tax=Sporobolomyces koalae TaxID=500713 RepID=UPI003175F31F
MAFPAAIERDIQQLVQDSVDEFVQHRNTGLPRAAVLATTSATETLVRAVAGFEQVDDDAGNKDSWPKITDESLFPLWSSTKLVTAIAALQLVEQGKIRLDDDASKYVRELKDLEILTGYSTDGEPEYKPNSHRCTIENLITHTAGFKYDAQYAEIQRKLGLASIYDENSTRESLTKSPFLLPPGTEFSYGTANDWLALLVAEVSGMPFDKYLEDNIFNPLGITDMTFTNPSNRVSVAVSPEFGLNPDAPPAPDAPKPDGPYTFDQGRQFTQSISWGGAGLTGSPKSYLKILRMLLRNGEAESGNRRVLEEATVQSMFEPRLRGKPLETFVPAVSQGNDPWSHAKKEQFEGVNYGLGGTLCGAGIPSGRSKGALTWSGYANSFWVVDREQDVAFIVWSCLLPHSHPAIMKMWSKVEPKIYEGIQSSKE